MRDEAAHIGASLGAIGVVAAILASSMAGLGAPWWAWTGFAVWGLLWLTAALGLSDPDSRKWLAGTLRRSTFTQIYTMLARRNVMAFWARLCDPASNDAPAPTLFRAALTWRLYDLALRLAMAYPLLLLVGQWVVTGTEGRVGSFVVLQAADFWPNRAGMTQLFVTLTGFTLFLKLEPHRQRPATDMVAGVLLTLMIVALFILAVGGAGAGAVTITITIAIILAATLTIAVPFRGVFTVACPCALALSFPIGGIVGGVVAGFGAFAIVRLGSVLDRREQHSLARNLLTGVVICTVVLAAITLDWTDLPEDRRSLFLFLAVLPLLNALFDVLSYAVTLTLIRRGLRSALPFLWGLADLAVACLLLLALGATLVAVIHGLNTLAGVPFLDLPALFAGVRDDPGAYVWLYLMLFSTLSPTLLHAALSLLGVQGIWPQRLRGPVAAWVEDAPESPLRAIRANFGLSLIWAIPLLVLGATLRALWHIAEPGVLTALSFYFDGLSWIAGGPLGAI